MRNIILFFSLLIFSFSSVAQQFANDWINHSQTYFKIPIVKDGIYRITYSELEQAGFYVSGDPRSFQIFARGEEQYIYVKGESDQIFHATDYIEFYAKKNDGWADTPLYESPEDQTNPYYSLINDTIFYYLTWCNSCSPRRLEVKNSENFGSYTTSPYCIRQSLEYFTNNFYADDPGPKYKESEGWSLVFKSSTNPAVATPNVYTTGPNMDVKVVFMGINNEQHAVTVDFFGSQYINEKFPGPKRITKDFSLSPTLLSDENSFHFVSSNDGRKGVSYIKIDYPHTYNFENKSSFKFVVPNLTTSKTSLNIQGFDGGSEQILYDLTSHERIKVVKSGSTYQAIVDLNTDKECYLVGESAIRSVSEIIKIASFTDFSKIDFNSEFIIISHPSLWAEATNYKTYRNTNYKTLLANIDELYDQFGYGINKHPGAIRNFTNYLINTYDSIPKYLLLIGKSISDGQYRNTPSNYEATLIPSMGNPPSDISITAGLNGTTFEPAIPTGRLSAITGSNVQDYLNKLQSYESNTPELWMKNIVHFGGGKTSNEQATFASYLKGYEEIIEGIYFGGNVSSFLKKSSVVLQITQADSIRNLINNGCTMMTFFGHGSGAGFDQNVDLPSAYNNVGKYPFILANSCLAGNIHGTIPILSEKWIFDKNGAIGFLASVTQGYPSPLNIYSKELYQNIGNKNYGKGIGYCISATIDSLQTSFLYNPFYTNTFWEMTLHGDPAVVLNSFEQSDLQISQSQVFFDPQIVTTAIDSFDVKIVITNVGKAVEDTFQVQVKRIFPNGEEESSNISVPGAFYKDTLVVRYPVDPTRGPGLNQFEIFVDVMGQIQESSELNNQVTASLLILSGDITPIFPYNYSIFPESKATLKASVGNVFIPNQEYEFQIDTTDMFSSPLKLTTKINQSGGVVTWDLPLTFTDSTVYYWRVRNTANNNWKESSFIYILDKTGWSQAHFFQFKNDEYKFIDYNRQKRIFEFVQHPTELHCHNIGSAWGDLEWGQLGYDIDGTSIAKTSCGASSAILVAVLDSLTQEAWSSQRDSFGHGNYNKCNEIKVFVFYANDPEQLQNLANFLDIIPNGNHILVYSFISGLFQDWPSVAYDAMEALGSTQIRTIPNNFPYIFYVQKGDLSSVRDTVGSSSNAVIDLYVDLISDLDYGTITSELIGPSKLWKTLHWAEHSLEPSIQDNVKLDVIGVTAAGEEEIRIDDLSRDQLDLFDLYEYVDADTYPYMKLQFFTEDKDFLTPSQLDRWQVTYEGIPETALNPNKGYYFYNDTVNEGEDIALSIATENISSYDMDSLLISYRVKDKNNNLIPIATKRTRPHPAGDVLMDTIIFNTTGYQGLNSIWVEVNAINPETGGIDQLEQYHFNNFAEKFFYVQSDKTNPILDVTFDGVHILNGDIISPKPEVVIQLDDENKYLPLNDTSLFAIYIRKPSSSEDERVYFSDINGNEILKFAPAELPKNSFKIIYNPTFEEDGEYQLRVQAKDASNNESGSFDYNIAFEVINKSTITDVFNYPNPFSTATRFVFTLTGVELPDDFRIQILTVTGKLVKEIRLAELGPINIGRNITEYAWDGNDMYGDRLANGVYFYQIITKINGQSIEKRETGADKYFKKGFGKMYLMR